MDLTGANLSGIDLTGVNLSGACLIVANLTRSNLSGMDLTDANLSGAYLISANLTRSNLSGMDLSRVHLSGADLSGANLDSANLRDADLSGANLDSVDVSNANLTDANLSGAYLRGANLTNASVDGVSGLEQSSFLTEARFGNDHRNLEDGSSYLSVRVRDRWLNWGRLRGIGQFPLFGVSWISLVTSVTVLNTIAWVNETKLLEPWITHSVPVPRRMAWLVVSSLLLVAGSTLYWVTCPKRVQAFSEEQYVEEHRQSRLLYLGESWSRRWLQWPTLLFTVTGGLSGFALALERIYVAADYIWRITV